MASTSACLKMDNEEFYMNSAFDDYEGTCTLVLITSCFIKVN